ncbi:S-adenosyl-L-methionine-dependent methyltransferase [Whalleya microplaca]|nr:S-adenosyl-L-methionine-dependent methyltransferase [Whalleya microplaca]
MATFARSTFSAKAYAAFRPTYPPSVYRTVLGFHQLPTPNGGTLLDLGCGHGLIARELSPHFSAVVAVDPSAGMVAQARQMTTATADAGGSNHINNSSSSSNNSNITFRQGGAEDLDFLADGAVDMAVAGQAAHWFDYGRAWPALARTVRPGGTLAFWGYKDNVLLGAGRAATAVMERFVYGFGEVAPGVTGMGPCWEQPGRNILRDLLRSVRPPERDWVEVTRLEHEPGEEEEGEEGKEVCCWLRKTMKLGEVENYTRTFSCFTRWREEHPEVKSRAEGGDGDIIDVMWDHMVDAVPEWRAMGEQWREVEVVNDWGTYILMARRR